jgi:hypothetical protein
MVIPHSFGTACGAPAAWTGRTATGFEADICDTCKESGVDARNYGGWTPIANADLVNTATAGDPPGHNPCRVWTDPATKQLRILKQKIGSSEWVLIQKLPSQSIHFY